MFTHWAREEDTELERGKLDDELVRMSSIVDRARPGDLLLCNEPFSSTDEAEGSQLALDVNAALDRAGIRVCYVIIRCARSSRLLTPTFYHPVMASGDGA